MKRPVKNRSVLEVASKTCTECLLTKNRIVPVGRAKEVLRSCLDNGRPFQCHKFTLAGRDVVCRSFFEKLGRGLVVVRLAHALDLVRYVDLPEKR